jgi:aconitate hydratase 2/2-methylisocitrate dehydratase
VPPAGVDQAAYVKAAFLADVAKGSTVSPLLDRKRATFLLGTMLGGYNILPLIELRDDTATAEAAATALSNTLLIYDAFPDVKAKAKADAGNALATGAQRLGRCRVVPESSAPAGIHHRDCGETNTDDLSPATEAWISPDIPLHAKAMLMSKMEGALETIAELKQKGHPLAFVRDVVGTGSSRKSAINSVLWDMGEDIPFVPDRPSP